MARKFFFALFALGVFSFGGLKSAQAIQISRNNPYRSYSISGMNYGAVQWELAQRKKAGNSYYSNGRSNTGSWNNSRRTWRTYRR